MLPRYFCDSSLRTIQKHPRVPIGTGVVRVDGERGSWRSVNLSEGGAFVSGERVFAPGTVLRVGMSLPANPDDIEVTGHVRVVWTNEVKGPRAVAHLPAGMGLQFLAFDGGARELLRRYLEGRATASFGLEDRQDRVKVGTVVNSYRILDLIGSGGMGDVYAAEHLTLGRLVALKRLRRRFTEDPVALQRFIDEGRMVNRIRHENIVEITDYICDATDKYYVMELLQGITVGDLIDRDGRLPPPRVVAIGIQLCSALAAVHAGGIIHRDLKPNNVFLTARQGVPDFVKLLDFGVAKLKDESTAKSSATRQGVVVGTPSYMAPEQCLGEPLDHRCDIYALGLVLYHALAGDPPFDDDSWQSVMLQQVTNPPLPLVERGIDVPEALETLVLSCLAKKPRHRPQSAEAIAARLVRVARDLETHRSASAVRSPTAPVTGPASAAVTYEVAPPAPRSAVPHHSELALQAATRGRLLQLRDLLLLVLVMFLAVALGFVVRLSGRAARTLIVDEETYVLPAPQTVAPRPQSVRQEDAPAAKSVTTDPKQPPPTTVKRRAKRSPSAAKPAWRRRANE
ncbi:MAG: protein kinase [Deltaproteobacteria bacterium]|nr:protein kinase [Deltaproteobacteria bacterium]